MNVSQIINVQAKAIEKGYSSMVYVKPYILTLQWANREDAIAYIKKVKLNNGQSLCFNQKTVEYAENQNLLKAVTKELNKCNQKLPFSTKCSPVLTAVNGPYQKSASALSTDFYNKRNIAFFLQPYTLQVRSLRANRYINLQNGLIRIIELIFFVYS